MRAIAPRAAADKNALAESHQEQCVPLPVYTTVRSSLVDVAGSSGENASSYASANAANAANTSGTLFVSEHFMGTLVTRAHTEQYHTWPIRSRMSGRRLTVLRVSSAGAAYLRLVASTAFPSSTGFAGTTGVPPKLSRSVANRCASAVSARRRSRLF